MNTHISLNDLRRRMAEGVPLGTGDEASVRRLWWAALDTLQYDILDPGSIEQGIWLASPLPALYEPILLQRLEGWLWAPQEFHNLNPLKGALPPSSYGSKNHSNSGSYIRMPLLDSDGDDPLLILLTPYLQVALALHGSPGNRNLLMRSDPETLSDLLKIVDSRLNQDNSEKSISLRKSIGSIGQLNTNKSFEKVFWPLLSGRLAGMAPSLTFQTLPDKTANEITNENESNSEITLLEALTHEVRTPLATIRTLIRSLLKRKDLSEVVINRLRHIDSECTEQIDRFGLIFNAAELQRNQTSNSRLASTDLGKMLEILSPAWKEQLSRRGIELELDITGDLPYVLSDPERLQLMLGGLIDRNTRGLQPGSRILLELRPAGHRLKLHMISNISKSHGDENGCSKDDQQNSNVGTVLSWNPNTGSLQLSQAATQRMLASLGGRLTRRKDRGLTIFFPIAEGKS